MRAIIVRPVIRTLLQEACSNYYCPPIQPSSLEHHTREVEQVPVRRWRAMQCFRTFHTASLRFKIILTTELSVPTGACSMSATSLVSTPRTERSERPSADQSKVRICSALKLVRSCSDRQARESGRDPRARRPSTVSRSSRPRPSPRVRRCRRSIPRSVLNGEPVDTESGRGTCDEQRRGN